MRQRRKCIYKDCDHNQGNKTVGCKFRAFPKDYAAACRWLRLAGVLHLTPQKILRHWCICSCHDRCDGERGDPIEYIELYDSDDDVETDVNVPDARGKRKSSGFCSLLETPIKSPAVKLKRIITPRTQAAADALVNLNFVGLPKATPTYSPKQRLWSLRSKIARQSARKSLSRILDYIDCDKSDLGVTPVDASDDESTQNNCDHTSSSNLFKSTDLIEVNNNSNHDGPTCDAEHMKDLSSSVLNDAVIFQTETAPISDDNSEIYPKENQYRSIGIQCERSFLCYEKAKMLVEEDFQFYTGITQAMFEILYKFLGGNEVCSKLKYTFTNSTPKRDQFMGDLTPRDKLFMTLLRLRRGIALRDLKVLFKISESHASRVVYTWVRFMSLQFTILEEHMICSAESQSSQKPKCFQKFPNLRGIIDSTEFRIQSPKHFQQQSNTYSEYKSGNTIKFLICISCYGGLSFLSEAVEGSMSDRKLLNKSELLNKLKPHDAIMADRGFDAEDLFDERDLELIIPAFLGNRASFTGRELILNRAVAVSRIHVETFIGKIKDYRLVRYTIPNSMLPIASDLVKVCAFLVNFQVPFVSSGDDDDEQ